MTPKKLLEEIEKHDFDYFLNAVIDRVPDTLDKREGSIIYDAIAPAAYAMAELNMNLYQVLIQAYAQTAEGEFLDLKAAERGIKRYSATFTRVLAEFWNEDNLAFSISVGDRFASIGAEPIFYVASKVETNGTAELIAEIAGEDANNYTGQILPVTPQNGLAGASIKNVSVPARDAESDGMLRERLFDQEAISNFGGNVSDYIAYAREIESVGAIQVYPTWNGGGTVKVVVVNNVMQVPNQTLLNEVQEVIDPLDTQGNGYGIAPIGHRVTVTAPKLKTVNVSASVTVTPSHTLTDLQDIITESVIDYFEDLRDEWGKLSITGRGYSQIIYRSQILAKMLQVPGVINVSNLMLDGEDEDIILLFDNQISELATIGSVVLNE